MTRESGSVLRPLLRSMPVALLSGGAAAAAAVVCVGRLANADAGAMELLRHQQFATVLAAAVAGMGIGDAASASLQSTPRYRWVGVQLRHMVVAGTFAASWGATLVALPGPVADLNARPLAIEAGGWLALGLAVGALAGSVAVPIVVVGLWLAIPFLPASLSMNVNAMAPSWSPAQGRWLALAVACAVLLAVVQRDPAMAKPFRVAALMRDR